MLDEFTPGRRKRCGALNVGRQCISNTIVLRTSPCVGVRVVGRGVKHRTESVASPQFIKSFPIFKGKGNMCSLLREPPYLPENPSSHTYTHTPYTHTLFCYHRLHHFTSCNYELCQWTLWLLHSLWICRQIPKRMPTAVMMLYLHCISHPVDRVLRAWELFCAPVEVELQGGVGRTQAASAHLHLVLLQVALDCAARRGTFFRGSEMFFFCFCVCFSSLCVF